MKFLLLICCLLFLKQPVLATEHYVSVSGNTTNLGTANSPWDLQTALNHPATVIPGDTIWLKAGTYPSSYTSHLKGLLTAPIIVRVSPNERVILDREHSNLIIAPDSHDVWFYDLEITYSGNTRDPYLPQTGNAIVATRAAPSSHGLKFINFYIHDTKESAYGWYESNYDTEIYGNLIYAPGTKSLDHGIYVHNQQGHKLITNNIIADPAGYGIHGYFDTIDKYLNGVTLTNNIIFDAGVIGCKENTSTCNVPKKNILLGGTTGLVAQSPVVQFNYTWHHSPVGASFNLGYQGGSNQAHVSNNYFMGGNFELGGTNSNLILTGNTIYYRNLVGINPSQYPNNTWITTAPNTGKIVVLPNQYDNRRTHLAIYNWSNLSNIILSANDMANLAIKAGDHYSLHNAQNYYGDIIEGTYNGTAIVIPMTGHSPAIPIGISTPAPNTFPAFGAFVMIITPASPPSVLCDPDTNQITDWRDFRSHLSSADIFAVNQFIQDCPYQL